MINQYNAKSHTSFKCDIVDYENPKENWCLLKIRVEQDGKVFDAIDPAIETTELPNLLNWFRCLSERKLPAVSGRHRFVQLPRPRVQGSEDGRPHGQRAGHHLEPRGRRSRCRAQPAAGEGLGAGPQRRRSHRP